MKIKLLGCPSLVHAVYDHMMPSLKSRGHQLLVGQYYADTPADKTFLLAPACGEMQPIPGTIKIMTDDLTAIAEQIYTAIGHSSGSALEHKEFIKLLRENQSKKQKTFVMNIKGVTGAGKSSAVWSIVKEAYGKPAHKLYYLVTDPFGTVHTYLPSTNTLILGVYKTPRGGCDSFTKEQVKAALQTYWKESVNIIFEGAIVSDTVMTYFDFMESLRKKHKREVIYTFLHVPKDVLIERLLARNYKGDLNIKHLDRKLSKFRVMAATYNDLIQTGDYEATLWILTAMSGSYVAQQLRQFVKTYPEVSIEDLSRNIGWKTDEKTKEWYFNQERKSKRTTEDVVRIAKKTSEFETERIKRRKAR